MNKRDLYKQKYEAQLHEWGAKVVELKARAEGLTAQAQLDLKPHLEGAHEHLEAVKTALADAASATGDKWDELTKGVDARWDDLKAAVSGAHAAVTRHGATTNAKEPTKGAQGSTP